MADGHRVDRFARALPSGGRASPSFIGQVSLMARVGWSARHPTRLGL